MGCVYACVHMCFFGETTVVWGFNYKWPIESDGLLWASFLIGPFKENSGKEELEEDLQFKVSFM